MIASATLGLVRGDDVAVAPLPECRGNLDAFASANGLIRLDFSDGEHLTVDQGTLPIVRTDEKFVADRDIKRACGADIKGCGD